MWMCRFAAMTPCFRVISPAGPRRTMPGVPDTSPEMRTGGVMPRATPSVREISTWLSGRSGPSTTTLPSWPFGPTRVTRWLQTNCPGWDRSRTLSSWWPGPNRASTWVRHRWTCRPLASRGTVSRSTTASASRSSAVCSIYFTSRGYFPALSLIIMIHIREDRRLSPRMMSGRFTPPSASRKAA